MKTLPCWPLALVLITVASCRKTEAPPPAPATAPSLPAAPRPKLPTQASASAPRRPQPSPHHRQLARPDLDPAKARALRAHLASLSAAPRAADPATARTDDSLPALLAAHDQATTEDARIEALHALAERSDPDAIAALARAATHGSTNERIAALEGLTQHPRAEHLPLVQAALSSDDPRLHAAGLWLLRHLDTEAALPVWEQTLAHPAIEVTQAAIDLLPDAPAFLQVPIARLALERQQPWLTEEALNLLGSLPSKPAVEALIPYLDHPQSGDLAQSGLFFLLSEHFDTAEQARAWWQSHASKLGPDLQPLDLE